MPVGKETSPGKSSVPKKRGRKTSPMKDERKMRFASKSLSTMTLAHDSERLPFFSSVRISSSVSGRYFDLEARMFLKFSTDEAKTLVLSTFFNFNNRCMPKK